MPDLAELVLFPNVRELNLDLIFRTKMAEELWNCGHATLNNVATNFSENVIW